MKNLWVRTVSGAVLAVVMLGAIAWSQWSFGLLLAALLVVGMTEFYSLAGEQGSNPQRIVGLAAGLVLFALNFAFVSDDIQILGIMARVYDDPCTLRRQLIEDGFMKRNNGVYTVIKK